MEKSYRFPTSGIQNPELGMSAGRVSTSAGIAADVLIKVDVSKKIIVKHRWKKENTFCGEGFPEIPKGKSGTYSFRGRDTFADKQEHTSRRFFLGIKTKYAVSEISELGKEKCACREHSSGNGGKSEQTP